tara:strand:- start:351 stop:668 length:318 start_codon:yes stop_codon:yes gene_type:complete
MNKREREYNKTFNSKNSKRFILSSNEFIYKGFLFKRKQDKDWKFTYYDIVNDHNPVFATHILSPRLYANSMKEARDEVDDLLRIVGVPEFCIYDKICGYVPDEWE